MQIRLDANLASGMTGQRKIQVVSFNAKTVVPDPDQFATARFDLDLDPRRAGINTILYQFFNNRRRPLHHLTRSDLVCKSHGEFLNPVFHALLFKRMES